MKNMIDNSQKISNACIVCKKSRKSSNPFILQCSHLLCLDCLQDCFSNIHSNYIECPSCKKQTSLDFFEKELDDFASTSGTPQSNQNISDSEYIKQQQQLQKNQADQQQQQLALSKNTLKNQKMEDNQQNGLYQRSQSSHQQQSNQINVYQDYYLEKQSQETSKSSKYKQGSTSNNQYINDPNSSNGIFLNSFEISSILPHSHQEQICMNNYSSPAFNSIQQSYTTPLDILIGNENNLNNETQKRKFDNEMETADENDFSQQLADNIIQESLNNSNKNQILRQEKQVQIVQQNNQTSNSSNSYNRLQTNQSKNSESLFSRSNSSASNVYTLQNNINNNSNNNVIQTTSTNANYQTNPANQSFSQSFIQPIQQSFVSVSGIKCKTHPDEEANLFCFQCHDNCMCINCFLQSGEHKEHEVKNVRNSFNQLIPLVQNLKERILLQVSDLKNDELLIVNRQSDIRNLCTETLTHLNKQVKEIVALITQKGEVLSKEIEIFKQEQLNELTMKHEKITKQLINLNTFSDSYDKILNFQGKCSEARMFNYFSDTKSKVNKYIQKLQKQNEEMRSTCRAKYTSCYPEHLFNDIELQIQQISIPFTISQPFSLPTSQLPSSPNQLQQIMQTPINNSNSNKNSNFFQQQQINQIPLPSQKRLSQQFDDKSLKESKIIDFDQIKMNSGQVQVDLSNNQPNSSFTSSQKKLSNSAVRYNKQPRDSRMNSGHTYNASMINNSNLFDQNYYQNSVIKVNRVSNLLQEPLMERNQMFQYNSPNKTSKLFIDIKQRLDTNDQDLDYQQQQISNNPFNLKPTQFQFNNQTKNNIVKLKLQEMPIILPQEIQTSDSFIIQNPSNKIIKSINRVQNSENLYESIPVTSVKDCVQLIKNTLKSRGASHSQLRERIPQNPSVSNEPYRYKSNLKENRYSVPKLDTKKIDQLLTITTLTQKSTERERIGKSNDRKIKELKKILNEGW
ncbi:hypothetical protein ABPG72_010574 [Tetrahymena utriculariae]